MSTTTYYSHFPSDIRTSLESGAYQSLCQHLRERSAEVQNIDLMSISGFCRNCLAKWLVLEARKLSAILKQEQNNDIDKDIITYLDGYEYDDAAKEVYGSKYKEWKERYGKKATNEQLKRYNDSTPLHAKHDHDVTTMDKSQSTNRVNATSVQPILIHRMLEAGAFRSLCSHLRDRSDLVQNIDLMTVSGFCRNCLSKWLVLEARKMVNTTCQSRLDAFGYDEASEEVYGCQYSEWKKAHATKATDAQMATYKASEHIHAKHNKATLAKKNNDNSKDQSVESTTTKSTPPISTAATKTTTPLLSNVCCQDMEPTLNPTTTSTMTSTMRNIVSTPVVAPLSESNNRTTYNYIPPPPPEGSLTFTVGILTVSDRANSKEYVDLSGPKLEESVLSLVEDMNRNLRTDEEGKEDGRGEGSEPSIILCNVVSKAIVPDETERIQDHILAWSGKKGPAPSQCDLILTTGGTGFSPRDVTPEATLALLDRECRGLISFCAAECATMYQQPLAVLTRGHAGIVGERSIVVNLPGSPVAVGQMMGVLFPLLVHAVRDMKDQ